MTDSLSSQQDNVTALHPEPTFDEFWAECYWKVGKVLAKAKWDAITNGGLRTRMLDKDSGQYVEVTLEASPEEIVEGMRRYVKQWPRLPDFGLKDAQYMMRPATFLNRGGWLDG